MSVGAAQSGGETERPRVRLRPTVDFSKGFRRGCLSPGSPPFAVERPLCSPPSSPRLSRTTSFEKACPGSPGRLRRSDSFETSAKKPFYRSGSSGKLRAMLALELPKPLGLGSDEPQTPLSPLKSPHRPGVRLPLRGTPTFGREPRARAVGRSSPRADPLGPWSRRPRPSGSARCTFRMLSTNRPRTDLRMTLRSSSRARTSVDRRSSVVARA